jgi:CelD/BcsL family acetyltransferase involved in cellulose biosynthesis
LSELAVHWLGEESLGDPLRSEWSDLLGGDREATLFLTPEWTGSWWRHLGSGTLRVLTIRRGARLVCLLPLVERRKRLYGVKGRLLEFAGEPEADLLGALRDPGDDQALDAAVREISKAAGSVDVVRLSEVAVGSSLDRALEKASQACGLAAVRRVCGRAPILALNGPWNEIEASYPKALRVRLHRARKKQENAGEVRFRRWQPAPDEVASLLERLRAIEGLKLERWRAEGRQAEGMLVPPRRWAFIQELSPLFAERGWLDVATLEMDGRLVAYRYGFRFRDAFLDYNLAHDPRDDAFSPGRTLLDEIIRDSHRIDLHAVEASRGRLHPPHLLADWTPNSRWHVRWTIFGRSLRGRLLLEMETRVKPWWRWLRRVAPPAAPVPDLVFRPGKPRGKPVNRTGPGVEECPAGVATPRSEGG